MRITQNLCALTLQQIVGGACQTLGQQPGMGAVDSIVTFLTSRFIDHSQRLNDALEKSHSHSWRALEVALAGDSLWDRCKVMLSTAEDKAFRDMVKPFLDAHPLAELSGKAQFRQDCLRELKAARAEVLNVGGLDPQSLAQQAGAFARYGDPDSLLDAEAQALEQVAEDLKTAGFVNLAAFVATRPQHKGSSLLVIAGRYFFRRSVEDDPKLFQGLAFAKLEAVQHAQDRAFAGLGQALRDQGRQLETLLLDLQTTAAQTLETVTATQDVALDIRAEQQRQGEEARAMYKAVLDMQARLDLMHTDVRPRDSLSIRSDTERHLVRELVQRYRQMPQGQRDQLPALLNAIGKLEVASGDFQAAQADFVRVAGLVGDPRARAEAHHNAYRAALERREWETALAELREAAKLDPARFSPFPMGKYQPQRILGAGGFGVAFLCRHRFLNADVVVKTLADSDLDRGVDQVFGEAQALQQLNHPAIIRIQDCGFASPDEDARPYLVMDYFPGQTLEDQARTQPLSVEEFWPLALQMAEGLQAAHAHGILHRDVKPANLLVRKEASGYQAKLIDFGLALRRDGLETIRSGGMTLAGSSIAGTLDYAAPEQMGRLPGTPVRPYSDVYGFARTCFYALFQTPQPLMRHWRSLPAELGELLESCLEDNPDSRPQSFEAVLKRLRPIVPGAQKVETPRPAPAPPSRPLPTVQTPRRPVTEMSIEQRKQELAAMAQEVAGCQSCAWLARSRTNTVFGTGPLDADICFVGEAPGADEDRTGQPFVGPSGQVLDSLLAAIGYERSEVYVCNLLKCRPPGNRQPQAQEVNNCRGFLDRQLELVKPKYIVALGGSAAQALLNTAEYINKLRGKFHDYRGIPVLCTYHPAYLLPTRSPEKKRDVLNDLKLILRRLGRPIS